MALGVYKVHHMIYLDVLCTYRVSKIQITAVLQMVELELGAACQKSHREFIREATKFW